MVKAMNPVILTVSQLTDRIKRVLEQSLGEVWVQGEISNFVHHGSGHMYFSLKDADAYLRCAMFRGKNRNLQFMPANGVQVRVRGMVGVWPPQGTYQLYVEEMVPAGLGALYQAFEELKGKLSREGLFDARHKRPIPGFPSRVGIVTSPTGAAIRDIVTVIGRRFPLVDLVLCPARVQGDAAAAEIVHAIRTFDRLPAHARPDVLIVGRGGGSIEDLWPFNEENVARAVFACSIPIISAVGHEIDFTICDFVADVRAPTPSAAAECAVPDMMELRAGLTHMAERMSRAMTGRIKNQSLHVDRLGSSRLFLPDMLIRDRQMAVDRLTDLLGGAVKEMTFATRTRLNLMERRISSHVPHRRVVDMRSRTEKLSGKLIAAWAQLARTRERRLVELAKPVFDFSLDAFRRRLDVVAAQVMAHNPRAVLERGYAICLYRDGSILSSTADASPGLPVQVEMKDGVLDCEVRDIRRRSG
ncbi:exodeoxyribonuclease VII large subunit [bacterium]|nr:exodeoxyribonuclease VII large subunit [candidate division CSSED10-310 bacterium]